jgi:hypothetical protein
MRHHLKLKQTALIAALASIYPLQVLANAGVTQFAVGDVSIQRAASSSPLASGSRIESGDLITTGNTGRTQLRFTDGGMVSLQPNSQLRIARYADAGDGKQDSFLVDLARGGMRALTGLIGKRNKDNYKVTTSTATIGIRGSGFSMGYNPDGTLGITTELDAIEVCNQAGCIGLNLGESALVVSATALPTRTNVRAAWNPPNPRRLITARNDDVGSDGRAATIRVETGLALTSAGIGEDGRDIRLYLDGAAAGNAASGPILGYAAKVESRDVGASGQITEVNRTGTLASGDLMVLGTWQGAEWTGGQADTLSRSTFVMGAPAPQSALAAAAGKQARYNLSEATTVFSSSSLSEGTLMSSSHVNVDFGNAQRQLDVNLDVRMRRISMQNPAEGQSGTTYNFSGDATTSSAGFYGSLSLDNGEGTGRFKGFFGGPGAEKLGLSFEAETYGYDDLVGAGVFTRGALSSPPNVAVAGVGLGAGTAAVYLNGTLAVDEGDVVGYVASNGDMVQVTSLNVVAGSGVPGDANFLQIGKWGGLSWNRDGSSYNDNEGAFVMGTPAPATSFPSVGRRAQYSLQSATPVYKQGDSTVSGTLLSTSNLKIDFVAAGQFVDVELDVSMPGARPIPLPGGNLSANTLESPQVNSSPTTDYQLRGSASAVSGAFKGLLSVNTLACSYGDNCGTGQVTGFIAGSNADKVGASFSANTGSGMHGVIYGAGIFNLGDGTTPTPSYSTSSNSGLAIAGASLDSGTAGLYSGETASGALASFSGSFLTNYTESGGYGAYGGSGGSAPPNYAHVPGTASHFAAFGAPTESDFIGWGYWAQANKTTYSAQGPGSSTSTVNHLHYLVGKPTDRLDMPRSGSASYTLLGGTNPMATLNGVTQTGQLLPSSNLNVNFTNARVDANIDTRFGTVDASFTGVAGIYQSSFSSQNGPSQINGFFTGPGAVRAGVVYQHTHSTLGTIQGAAGFQRSSGTVRFGYYE